MRCVTWDDMSEANFPPLTWIQCFILPMSRLGPKSPVTAIVKLLSGLPMINDGVGICYGNGVCCRKSDLTNELSSAKEGHEAR